MTALTLSEWEAIWQRFHDAARARHASPNQAVAWADGRMAFHRHGSRPVPVEPEEAK